jgi:acylphosphatase
MNNAIKAAEQKVNAFMKGHHDTSMNVMARVSNSNTGALMKSTFVEWRDLTREAVESNRLDGELQEHAGNLKSFAIRNKGGAQNVHKRAAGLLDLETYIFFFSFWKRIIKIDLMKRYGEKKVRDQKDSLLKVKGAVQNFAGDLEGTLRLGTPPGSAR